MAIYEMREIERVVKIYRVDAESSYKAEDKHSIGESELVESYPIDAETGEPWHVVQTSAQPRK